ncbi:MAG: glutamine-hydrolyzing GMP synthase [Bryobacteraceae bacterium]|nr:glutamine-hydrolyzing GMP synthase [Bryobacteraceae bacterium]MDW8379467.1 glutamine-hydrolyzing GMP synthase [Bryobacterales bacterium]
MSLTPQIIVLDTGGQYCHLIARKVRELGVYAEVRAPETPAAALKAVRGIIISGGPASVYEENSPSVDPALFSMSVPVLGICYGQHLMAHLLGGRVQKGDQGEYGLAYLDVIAPKGPLRGISGKQRVWMSHRDTTVAVPPGFEVLAQTSTCPVAAMGDERRKLFGLQFHPEVAHTQPGGRVLANFLFDICGCVEDWDPRQRIPAIEEQIRQAAAGRKVFFFVSGGVDSTVAFDLCLRALGPERVHGAYVDTGLMREGETELVRTNFAKLGARNFRIVDASAEFLTSLAGVVEPEVKRQIIGEHFVAIQEQILQSGHYTDSDWVLGQGTIYPDTIESGGTAKADKIKTHHNRVAGIQKLIESGRIVEPLSQFYKDEVREIGRQLEIPEEMLSRHPFPGPALAIRCLCSREETPVRRAHDGYLLPVRSVGVQGDSRTYRAAFALPYLPSDWQLPTELINRHSEINRVVAVVATHTPVGGLRSFAATITEERLERLRRVDAAVQRLSQASGFDRTIWQFPVILLPVGTLDRPDSVVLRPVDSVDGMTAEAVRMPDALLEHICRELLETEGVSTVFYDLTHKPPATIEWE